MQVADHGLAAQDGLSVQLEHETQHAVSTRVLGPHVDDHRFAVGDLDVDILVRHAAQHGPLLERFDRGTGLGAGLDLLRAFVGFRGEICHRITSVPALP